jgi:hypothetical protein
MALVENSIHTFQFIDLAGQPDPLKPQIQVVTRAGVDGVTLVNDGTRGTPFVLRSKVDQTSLATARQTFLSYRDLIGGAAVEAVWQDVDLFAEGTLFEVLDVRQVVLRKLAIGVGGFNPPSEAWLECDWTLIAVEG